MGAPFWFASGAALLVTFFTVWVVGRTAVVPLVAVAWLMVVSWATWRGSRRQRSSAWIVLAALGLVLVTGVVLTG